MGIGGTGLGEVERSEGTLAETVSRPRAVIKPLHLLQRVMLKAHVGDAEEYSFTAILNVEKVQPIESTIKPDEQMMQQRSKMNSAAHAAHLSSAPEPTRCTRPRSIRIG